jgi:copper(I)-binding protein
VVKTLRFLIMTWLVLQAVYVQAEPAASDSVIIENPFARASAPGMQMSGAFMTLLNQGKVEHFVVAANSDAAKHVELHMHVHENGVMRMRRVAHFHLKPGQKKVLKPGGLHIMLMGLTHPLTEGTSINIELQFSDGSKTAVAVPVKSISAMH